MLSLTTYINESLLFENIFTDEKWSHNGKFDYAKTVVTSLLNGDELRLGYHGDEGTVSIKDFNKDKLNDILKDITKTTAADFNNAYTGDAKNIWRKLFKGDISGKFRKINGGLSFEAELTECLKALILNIDLPANNAVKSAQALFEKIKGTSTINKLKEKATIDNIDKYVFVSGSGKTSRNNDNQIINKDTLEININKKLSKSEENDIENVLTQSGKIIADVTITADDNFDKSDFKHINKEDIFISCKDGASQFSGISMQMPFYGTSKKTSPKSDLLDSFADGESYAEYNKKDTDNVKSFNNLCKLLCIDPNEVYDYYAQPKSDRKKKNIKTVGSVDGNLVSVLIQLLIGGNYWYVNSDSDPIYIDDDIDTNRFKFEPDNNAHLEPTLIAVSGNLNGRHAEIKFRDSAGTTAGYPFRLFIVPREKHLINRLFSN